MNIRKMTPADFEQVFELLVQSNKLHVKNRPDVYKDVREIKDLRKARFDTLYEQPDTFLFVAEADSKIIGFCSAFIKPTSGNPAKLPRKIIELENIVVDENHRKQGIGRQLYDTVIKTAKQNHVDSIELTVFSFNKDAICFYEDLGMTVKNITYEQKI